MNDQCVTYNNSPHFCSRYFKVLSNILWRLCLCEEGFSACNILQRNPKEDQLSNSSSYMLLKSPLLRCQNSGSPHWKHFGDSQPQGKTDSHKTIFVAGNAERRVGKRCPAFQTGRIPQTAEHPQMSGLGLLSPPPISLSLVQADSGSGDEGQALVTAARYIEQGLKRRTNYIKGNTSTKQIADHLF